MPLKALRFSRAREKLARRESGVTDEGTPHQRLDGANWMGWKLAVAISRLKGRTLQALVDEIYGAPQTLEISAVAVLDALYPWSDRDRYAFEHEGFGWIFDANLASRAIEKPLPVRSPVSVFLLHGVTGLYGFSTQANGKILRSRSGSTDDGVIADVGTPSDAEVALVCAGVDDAQAAWNAWCEGADTFDDGEDDDMLNVLSGEEVVFGLIDALTGVRIDSTALVATKFHAARVMKIVGRTGFFAKLFPRR